MRLILVRGKKKNNRKVRKNLRKGLKERKIPTLASKGPENHR